MIKQYYYEYIEKNLHYLDVMQPHTYTYITHKMQKNELYLIKDET